MRYAQSFFTLLMLLSSGLSWADSSQCYAIRDADMRRYCLAETRGNRSDCYAIQDHDKRTQCLAEVGGRKSDCYSIHDADERSRCLARF